MNLDIKKQIKNVPIFSNMVEIDTPSSVKTFLHEDGLTIYNSWHLTEYHFIDKILFRGNSSDLPNEYKSYLPKIGNPKNVIVTQSKQDTY